MEKQISDCKIEDFEGSINTGQNCQAYYFKPDGNGSTISIQDDGSGNHYLQAGPESHTRVSYSVPTESGVTYDVEFDLVNGPAGNFHKVVYDCNGAGQIAPQYYVSFDGNNHATFSFTAASNMSRVKLLMYGNQGIDNLQVCRQQGAATGGPEFLADIKTYNDYYPFGMMQPGRVYNTPNYSRGFNGQIKTDEIAGEGNHNTARYWEYDTRLGRRWNEDPKPNASISNYATYANNPIIFNDFLGDTIKFASDIEEDAFNAYKKKVFSNDKYEDIQKEITEMEKSETTFRIRTGDRMTSESGGGNTRYNSDTKEIDINYDTEANFSKAQRLAHELKHGHQFLEGKIGFKSNGSPDGVLNDYQDEFEAYKRANRFAGPGGSGYLSNDNIHKIIRERYGYNYRSTNKTLKTISNKTLNDMIRVNKLYIQHSGEPKFIYKGYKSDLK